MELCFDNDADRDDPVVQAFLARIPEAQRLHAARGLTDEESWQTLQDLARHARLDRLLYGTPGLKKGWWVELAFSGRLFALGRLQFEPTDCGFLNIHIPEAGPLTPAGVDASLARACELFPEYPEARCSSWLLDPQLASLLPSGSNILSFQRRFEPIADEGVEPRVLEYVFHAFEPDLERLPRDTTLQRAIVDHLRGGGQLHRVTGTLGL